MSTNTSCGTVEVIPGDELHLTMIMAPMSLNLVTGGDRQALLAYARSVWQASRKQALADAASLCHDAATSDPTLTARFCAHALKALK